MRNHLRVVLTLSIFGVLLLNPGGYSTEYGTGNGIYQDRVDSFSEYSVRNTVSRNILSEFSFIPIYPKDSAPTNYSYIPELNQEYQNYFVNLQIQSLGFTILAKTLGLNTQSQLDKLFTIMRYLSCFILSLALTILLMTLMKRLEIYSTWKIISIVFLSSSLVGFSYFNSNLYFLSFIFVIGLIIPLYFERLFVQLTFTFVWSLVNFLHGYEFVTVYFVSMLSMFWIARILRNERFQIKDIILFSFTLISSFLVSLLMLIVTHVLDKKANLTFLDSTSNIFNRILARNISDTGVPARLSSGFFSEMYRRWTLDGINFFNLVTISQLGLVLAFTLLLLFKRFISKKFSRLDVAVTLFSFGSYFSWYIFGYQHIMWHYMYDWYIFAVSFGLGTIFLGASVLQTSSRSLVKSNLN